MKLFNFSMRVPKKQILCGSQYRRHQLSHLTFLSSDYVLVNLKPAPRSIRNRTNKFNKNIEKRGNVPAKKSTDEEEEKPMNPLMIGMFVFLVVGSSLVQVMRLFQTTPAIPKDE